MTRLLVPALLAGVALAVMGAPASFAQDHAPDRAPDHAQDHPAAGEHPEHPAARPAAHPAAHPAPAHRVVHKRVVVQKHVDEHVTEHVTGHDVTAGRGRWHSGDHFSGNRVAFTDYGRYHLRQPPPGYEWVEDNGELVLISLDTGLISDIFLIPIP